MKDPYEVLGIGKNASQDEIKAAYRELAKKYHPDRYQNNPLADLAEEKLKEVNEAYDYLCGSSHGGGGYAGGSNSGNNGYSQSTPEFDEVRQYINRGNLRAAEKTLNRSQVRNGEWYFLRGMISYRSGWHDDALANFQQAVSMEPENYEYKNALTNMSNQRNMYQNSAYGRGYNRDEDLMCKMCQAYICADICCDCI